MAEAMNGVHAFATSVFMILLLYFTWDWTSGFMAITTGLLNTVLWIGYILAALTGTLIVPYLIATGDENEANVLSAAMGYGTYVVFAFLFTIFYRIIDSITTGLNTADASAFGVPENTAVWLVALVFFLLGGILAPFLVSTMPNAVWETTKKAKEMMTT